MNRLSNYFASQKLAKQYLGSAYERLDRCPGQNEAAVRSLAHAVEEMITAMNNVASIAFHAKPKRKRS